MSLQEKGWQVKVCWKDEFIGNHCIGIGTFAEEDISEGTVLRIGIFGSNMVIYNSEKNAPNVAVHGTMEYLLNYSGACPCNVAAGGEDLIFFLPGCGVNHSPNANCKLVCTVNGVCLVATRDIKNGTVLGFDYNSFGTAPEWYKKMLRDNLGTDTCVFPGLNDYV